MGTSAATGTPPSDYGNVYVGTRQHNVLYSGDPVTISWSSSSATTYYIADWEDNQLATGSLTTSPMTLPVTAGQASSWIEKYGSFRIRVTGPDAGDGLYGTDKGCGWFHFVANHAEFPQDPLRGQAPTISEAQSDPSASGVFGLGPQRLTLQAKLAYLRQYVTSSGTGVTTLTASLANGPQHYTGGSTSASILIATHFYISPNGTPQAEMGATPAGWTLASQGYQGAVGVKVYTYHGHMDPAVVTATSTVSANQRLVLMEAQWSADNTSGMVMAPIVVTGNGSSASLVQDFTTANAGQASWIGATMWATSASMVSPTFGYQNYGFELGDQVTNSIRYNVTPWNTSLTFTANFGATTDYVGIALAWWAQDTYTTDKANFVTNAGVMKTWWGNYGDPVRPRKQFVSMNNDTVGYGARVTRIVQDTFSDFVIAYEGENEPNNSGTGYSYAEYQEFHDAVLAGNPSAIPLISTPDSMNEGRWGTYDFWIKQSGGDIMSLPGRVPAFHYYNMFDGDIPCTALPVLTALKSRMQAYGVDTSTIWATEGCTANTAWGPWNGGIAGGNSLLGGRTMAGPWYTTWNILCEVILGIPYERLAWYYVRRGGYDENSFWFVDSANNTYPAAHIQRSFAYEVRGKTMTTQLDFGDAGRVMVGGWWTTPGGGPSVAVLVGHSPGLPDVTLAVSGTHQVTVVDHFGNETVTNVVGGTVTLGVSDCPVYVRLPAGATCGVRPFRWGPTLFDSTKYLTSFVGNIDTNSTMLRRLADPTINSPYRYNSGDPAANGNLYTDTNAGTSTRQIDMLLPSNLLTAPTIDKIMVLGPKPWQGLGVLLDFDVYTRNYSTQTWTLQKTITQTPKPARTVRDHNSDTAADITWSPQCQWFVDITPTQIDGIRLVIRSWSRGMYTDANMWSPPGQISIPSGSITIASVEAYNTQSVQLTAAIAS